MLLSIEHLPTELWFIIFSFIEGNDLQKAFSNLNAFFTELLNSPSLRVYLDIKTGGCKVFNSSRTSFRPEAFEALHANLNATSDLLIFLDSIDILPNLRSLSVHIRGQKNYRLLESLLPQLKSLQHLAISCTMFNVDTAIEPLCNEILNLPQLKMCELRLSRNASNLPNFNSILPINKSLRHFHINATISSASLCHLVQFMPSLRVLNVHLYRHDMDGWSKLGLPQLTKNACASFVIPHVYLKDLAKAAPNLLYFYIHIEPYSDPCWINFFKEYNLDNSKIKNVHVRMIWKKNIISGTFDIILPVVIQGRNSDTENWIVGRAVQEYTIIKTYSNFA